MRTITAELCITDRTSFQGIDLSVCYAGHRLALATPPPYFPCHYTILLHLLLPLLVKPTVISSWRIHSFWVQVRQGKRLDAVIQGILMVGNAVNVGTAYGNAQGIKLDSLLKLADGKLRSKLPSGLTGRGFTHPGATCSPAWSTVCMIYACSALPSWCYGWLGDTARWKHISHGWSSSAIRCLVTCLALAPPFPSDRLTLRHPHENLPRHHHQAVSRLIYLHPRLHAHPCLQLHNIAMHLTHNHKSLLR